MNTITSRIPMLRQIGMDEYVFLLEDYEPAMYRNQLLRIMSKWQQGMTVEEISDDEKRARVEVFMALLHLADKGYELRSFDGRI